MRRKVMNREEKVEALVNRDMDNIFNDYKDLERFVANVLKNGFEGYNKLSNEDIDGIYTDIFEEEDDEEQ
jgi:hypothetical protein